MIGAAHTLLMGAEPPLPPDDHVRLLVPRADKLWQTDSRLSFGSFTSEKILTRGLGAAEDSCVGCSSVVSVYGRAWCGVSAWGCGGLACGGAALLRLHGAGVRKKNAQAFWPA